MTNARKPDALPESGSETLPTSTRRGRLRRYVSFFALLACASGCLALLLVGGRAVASSTHAAPGSEADAQDMSGQDFSKYLHNSPRHASIACASCHRREANNSPNLKFPVHKDCTDCHLPQFVSANIPMCEICHTNLNQQKPPLKNFPSLQGFSAKFDHAQHNVGAARPASGCVACHAPMGRRAAALSISYGLNAHVECYACHSPNAQANGRDIASCGVCHQLGRHARTPTTARSFSASFSHATHGPRQGLSCAECHDLRAGAPQTQQVTSTRLAQHFPSSRAQNCMTCHNGRRAFGDADFGDCKRCHKGQTFGMGA